MSQSHEASGQGSGWVTLFDGSNLNEWEAIGNANWRLVGDSVQADLGNGYLVSKKEFTDFEIKAEFWVDTTANSGIFIRCAIPTEVTPKDRYEVNIFDTRPDPSYGTGAIVNVAKVARCRRPATLERLRHHRQGLRPHGDPQRPQDRRRGQDSKYPKGRIALQFGAGVVKFRKVEIARFSDVVRHCARLSA